MARHRGVIGVLVAMMVVVFAMLLSAGVPITDVFPPLTTVVAVVAAPIGVVLISQLLPEYQLAGAVQSHDLRRAEAAHAPRPRRIREASGGSTPGRLAVDSMAGAPFEPPESFTL